MSPLTQPLALYAAQVVVVGVSGGADSVALLRALLLAGARPVVAHVDHALRPESAKDAEWVNELAVTLDVPFESVRVDVAGVAQKRGWNLEDAGRRVRYDFLTRVAKQSGAQAILTAHTGRDQAETVLIQLLRGEAVLSGIPAVRGRIHRPWLTVSRPEIEAFLHTLNQPWLEDSSNSDTTFTRAWLRSEIMPILTARSPGLEGSLGRLARFQQEDDAALQMLAAQITPHVLLGKQPAAVLRRWLHSQLRQQGMTFQAGHLLQLAQAIQTGETLHLTLPDARNVTVSNHKLHLTALDWPTPAFPIPEGWEQRTRRDGDRIRLSGGTRKLSDLFTDLKLPRQERDRVSLLVADQGVQWVGTSPPIWAVGAREQVDAAPDPIHAAMGEALNLACRAAEAQEVPVGAVVITGAGQIVGRGRNTSRQRGDMTMHAELAALREAAQNLRTPYLTGCTLVVTLEPCPMCLGAALEARLGGIVYGALNPKAGALGGVTDLLAPHWGHLPSVQGGVRAAECARLLKSTFQQFRMLPPTHH